MKKIPLVVRSVHVKEAPGISDGLAPLSELSPGINIVHGPNASGKSTTMRLMQASLSPAGRGNPLRLAGDRVMATIEAGDAATQITLRDQAPAEAHPQALDLQSDLVNHCRFSLKELLDATGRDDFGQAIEEAAAGGINLVQTAKGLRMDDRKTPRPTDRNDLQSLRRGLRAAVNTCAAMEKKEQELEELRKEAYDLSEKQEQRGVLEKARAHREDLDSASEARTRLEVYPEILGEMSGEEVDEIRNAEGEIAKAEGDLVGALANRRQGHAGRRSSALRESVPEALLTRNDQRREHFRDLELQRDTLEQNQGNAATRMEAARDLIGSEVTDNQLAQVDTSVLQKLEAWCDQVEAHQGNESAVQKLKSELGDLSPPPSTQTGDNITFLREWLAAFRQEQRINKVRTILLVGAGTLLVLSLILGFIIHPWLLVMLAGAAAIGVGWWLLGTGGCTKVEQETSEHGLRAPAAWNVSSVNGLIREIEAIRADELERQGRSKQWAARLPALEKELESIESNLETERTSLTEELGFSPVVGEKSFGILAQSLRDWQRAQKDYAGAQSGIDTVDNQISELRKNIRTDMQKLVGNVAEDSFSSSDVAGWIADLRGRNAAFGEASRDLKDAWSATRNAVRTIRTQRNTIAKVYEKLGLESGHFNTLSELVSQLDDFRATKQELAGHTTAISNAQAFFEDDKDLANRSIEELESDLTLLGDSSSELQKFNQEIGAIEADLKRARNATDVESKRREFEERRQELHSQRERRLHSVAGWSLAKHIHEQVSSETVPEVQNRAGKLLTQFTNGRCEVTLVDGKLMARQPGQTNRPMDLDSLSDGTRVQLFIAMRLAFVEKQEGGYRLPLFFDEALANTDDDRARAVMETLIAIAGEGRQVIYFTSQADEAAKWTEALVNKEVESKLLPLLPQFGEPPVIANLKPPKRFPEPKDGESYAEYAQLLGMPEHVDPWIQSSDEVHLEHVLDDARDLASLLEIDVKTWGPLARLGSEAELLRDGAPAFERASKRAQFLVEVARLWQQGRGRPLEKEDLKNAGVTNTPTSRRQDHAWEGAKAVSRDAQQFCEALESKALKIESLGKGGIEKLRAYCEEHELIVSNNPLVDGEILLQAQTIARRNGLPEEDAQRLLTLFSASNSE